MTSKNIAYLIIAGLILTAVWVLGEDFSLFINPAGLLLVVGGTLAGVFLAFPLATIKELWRRVMDLRRNRVLSAPQLAHVFVQLARLQRIKGARIMEAAARKTGKLFLEMGVGMVADERPRLEIRERLEQEFDFFLSRREAQRAILTLMGRLAPAFGLAGTMIGLIRMLHTINDPSEVASGMSVALLTTFYGIMLANLIILPLERKLNEQTRAEAVEMTMILEGVMGLCAGENGAAMQARLNSFKFAAPVPDGQSHPAAPDQGGPAAPVRRRKGLLRGIRIVSPIMRSLPNER